MNDGPDIAEIATLIGDPARASMLTALMDGRALTATELSLIAGITPQTASAHLKKMAAASLLSLQQQGRHRYFRLASSEVAQALEALMVLSQKAPRKRLPGPRDAAMRHARTCYDHLAGERGVAVTDALVKRGYLAPLDQDFQVTAAGEIFFQDLGLDLPALQSKRRAFARQCLDWSERRPHLGGALGAALLTRFEAQGWMAREADSRRVTITAKGDKALAELTGS
ncbi:ArsR/SmtB family transcription factor [Rhodovibrionaceae bacterium A322]